MTALILDNDLNVVWHEIDLTYCDLHLSKLKTRRMLQRTALQFCLALVLMYLL